MVWTNHRAGDIDNAATERLLDLREELSMKFDDKKNTKTHMWQVIANTMNREGFFVGAGKEGAERCRQKFSNLEKKYVAFINAVKTTGNEKKEAPPFYNKLHGILGKKHKYFPSTTFDSLIGGLSESSSSQNFVLQESRTTEEEVEEQEEENVACGNKRKKPNRNDELKKILKEMNDNIISTIKDINEENKNILKEQNRLFSEQNSQRGMLIQMFGEMVEHMKRPRID